MNRRNEQRSTPLITKVENRRLRPASFGIDVVLLTIIALLMVAGIAYCFSRGYIEWGVALSAALPWFYWRVWLYDRARLIEHSERHFAEPAERPVRERPITIEQTDGGARITYGKLELTRDQYSELYRAIVLHPRRRIVIDSVPSGIVVNLRSGGFGRFCEELRRLGWIDESNVLTKLGEQALYKLAFGD